MTEVTPAEWWKSLTTQEREAWLKMEARFKKGGRDPGRIGRRGPKNTSPTKGKDDDDTVVRKKTSLYQPAAQLEVDLPVEDPSIAPTPAEGSDGEVEAETQSDGDEQLDSYGTYLPKKPTPRNGDQPQNRFAVEPHITFEEDEVGIREHHSKRNNKNELSYSGMDPYPNPKKFHFDQVARALNSAKNKPEDLDQDLVAEFKVHPQYGLVVKGSVNPDWSKDSSFKPASDWSEPLLESTSLVFIEDGLHNTYVHDHDKPAWHNSRSNWMLKTDRSFEEDTTRDKVARILEVMNAREEEQKKLGLSTTKGISIDSALLEATNEGLAELKASNDRESQRLQKIRQELANANKPRSIWPPPTASIKPQRSLPYDPTKDTGNGTGYQTPYRQINQAPREDHSALDILAGEAEKTRERQPSQPQVYPLARWIDLPPQKKIRDEEGRSLSARSTARTMTGIERSRPHAHQINNSMFTPQQYSPQAPAGTSLPPHHLSHQHVHPHPAHQTSYQGFAQLPPHHAPHQQPHPSPPQLSLQSPHQLTQQLPQQHPPSQFSPQRAAPQQPGGLRALAPAPPQGRGSQPPQQQPGGWYGYGR